MFDSNAVIVKKVTNNIKVTSDKSEIEEYKKQIMELQNNLREKEIIIRRLQENNGNKGKTRPFRLKILFKGYNERKVTHAEEITSVKAISKYHSPLYYGKEGYFIYYLKIVYTNEYYNECILETKQIYDREDVTRLYESERLLNKFLNEDNGEEYNIEINEILNTVNIEKYKGE